MTKSTSRGFTLIELMMVVAIVGILTMIAYPNYQSYLRRGYMSAAQAYLLDVAQRLEAFRLDNRGYPEKAKDIVLTDVGTTPTLKAGQVSIPAPTTNITRGYADHTTLEITISDTSGAGSLAYMPGNNSYALVLRPATDSVMDKAPASELPRLILMSTGERCKTKNDAGGLCGPADKQWSDR